MAAAAAAAAGKSSELIISRLAERDCITVVLQRVVQVQRLPSPAHRLHCSALIDLYPNGRAMQCSALQCRAVQCSSR